MSRRTTRATLVLAVTLASSQLSAETVGQVDYFTDNGFGAAVKTMQHPAGEYHDGVTYVAYQGPTEDPYVASYNHVTGQWQGPYKAGESVLVGREPGIIDNHGKPAMIIDDEGYIHLVFGGHGGYPSLGENPLGNTHRGQVKHVVSKKPLDISAWEELDNVSPFGTYNQFVKMDNGDIYMFYRHGAHQSNWVYQKSTDNGRSFAAPVSVLKTRLRTDTPGVHDSWYAWFTNGQAGEIMVTYNYHLCREAQGEHIGERHNSYYMVMDTEDHNWRNVKGEALTLPVTKEHADDKALVVDTGDLWTVRGTVRMDDEGNPHTIFYMGEHMGLRHGGPKQTIHYRWTGGEWSTAESTALPVAYGDISVSSPENVKLLLASKTEGGAEVAWWNSTDGGQSFAKGEVLLKRDKGGIAITSFIRNAHPDARIMVAGSHKKDYRRMYLLGDDGPVRRSAAEANQLDVIKP